MKVKHLVLPTPKGNWPEPPLIDGTPPFHGDEVHHPTHGVGRYAYCDWVDHDGRWVTPLDRDSARGYWIANVTTKEGSYRCPISELSRR